MTTETIDIRVNARGGFLTLKRPASLNALDGTMIREISEAIQALNKKPEVRCIVLQAEGKAFCAGMNFNYLEASTTKTLEENVEDARALMKMLQSLRNSRKPTIALVRGPALGGGCGLAAACDFVIAVAGRASFGAPEVKVGFLPAVILRFLIARMGRARAAEFVLRGEVIDAATAHARGLVTEVVADDDAEEFVDAFVSGFATETSPSSVALTKELLSRLDEMPDRDAIEYACHLNALTRQTEDFRKGVSSFLKKEKLQW